MTDTARCPLCQRLVAIEDKGRDSIPDDARPLAERIAYRIDDELGDDDLAHMKLLGLPLIVRIINEELARGA